ncbi:hypothetical protein F5Y15DRAFT_48949 [Xylariaceae sp. FL0016]|nr:hypothetical protein F5Y15DRAFT_48949 [Xylariaceae sp. FL0016]
MNVSTVAMSSPTRPRQQQQQQQQPPQIPRDARFDSHDDFYEFLENNRSPGLPPSAVNTMNQAQRMPQGPQAQPIQSRPPVTNSFPDRSRPPSYSGSRSEELLVDKSAGARVARQNGRRATKPSSGSRPPTRANSPPSPWSGASSPNQPMTQNNSRPVSSGDAALDAAASIQRLKSPSVMNCVLQPLDQKVHEYGELMHREQGEMTRLEGEIRALQERRSEAEARFLEAKSKHDDYRRQYQDVERAMRGEVPLSREPVRQPGPRPISIRPEDDEDAGTDEDEGMAPPYHRRINSQQSFGRSSQQTKKDRFRFSIFGGK